MRITFALLLSLVGHCLLSQPLDLTPDRFAFEPELTYNADLSSPADYLGYELGDRFTEYEKSVNYFHYLAASSDRIDINQYGETYEGRPLLNLVISSPENLGRIDELRERHLQLLDADFARSSEGESIIDNDPVFSSFSYNIHGNEASSTEAAMQLAYRLAAVNDAATRSLLENSVLILYVCINPDGRDRYVYWINSAGRQLPGVNPRDFEHYAPWPNGRTNHYWFDLNRDWLWGVHPESRGHVAEYQRWMPQIHVDYHEQGYNANYFTAPGATPRNLLLPDSYEAWSDTFGRANIAAFDREGLMYFTRDRFDFFYPGYGSSYPSVMGAVGMLTEQGGIGAGRAVTTDDGYVLLLRQRIFDHYTTSLATMFKAAERREALLQFSVDAWNPKQAKISTQAYIIRNEEGGFLEDFLAVMGRQGIAVEQAGEAFTLTAQDYRTGQTASTRFAAGDYIIRTEQARHLLINSLLARNLAIEDSVMYDMATWSAPLAYNLEAYAANSVPKVNRRVLDFDRRQMNGSVNADALGDRPVYAYLIDWQQREAPKALTALWAAGYRMRSAIAGFSDGAMDYSAGTLIVLRGRNLDKTDAMSADMQRIARETGVAIVALPTGRMTDGFDLASSRNAPLQQPRAAMLVEPLFNTYSSGQVYYLFDQETNLPLDRIRTSAFEQTSMPKFGQRYGYADVSEYDVLILPNGRNLNRLFWQDQRYELLQWVSRGGTLVALESSASYFTEENKVGEISMVKEQIDTGDTVKYLTYEERERYRGLRRIPGSALRGTVDNSHPLAFGVKPEVYTLKLSLDALEPDARLESVGIYDRNPESLLTAGYASEENLGRLAGKTFAGVQRIGDGKIVYLIDNPHYRMFWRGASRMMQNAVLVMPSY